MHHFFENLVVFGAPSLQAYWMDVHHDTSLRFILEDDSINSSTFKTRIHFCLGKGVGLWLIAKPYTRSFHIAHFTLTSTLCFCFGFIQPLASNFLTCECAHVWQTLVCCSFGGQWITTYDTIQDVMYLLIWKRGHVVWKEW
jgi:hypothetical protein